MKENFHRISLPLEILGERYFTFLLWRHVKEEQIFMDNFLSKGFDEKCKHTELALNFVQKEYFSWKTHFLFIIVK